MRDRPRRIPDRATLIIEKQGVSSDCKIPCHIQLWSDVEYDGKPRMWFYCWRKDWRRIFLKAFTGKNYSEGQKWWDENVNLIETA